MRMSDKTRRSRMSLIQSFCSVVVSAAQYCASNARGTETYILKTKGLQHTQFYGYSGIVQLVKRDVANLFFGRQLLNQDKKRRISDLLWFSDKNVYRKCYNYPRMLSFRGTTLAKKVVLNRNCV